VRSATAFRRIELVELLGQTAQELGSFCAIQRVAWLRQVEQA
jgi:hypothetical protein